MVSKCEILLAFAICLLFQFHLSSQLQTKVEQLPGFQGPLPFQLETGYVGLGENDDDDMQVFYYFIKSENNPQKDPLMLWLTGGPGCSSFSGLAFQIGPLKFEIKEYDGSVPNLVLRSQSWTKLCSIIFVDLPLGTGFSYAKNVTAQRSDWKLVHHAHQFLRKWLIDHPEFLSNEFYMGADSYSGIPAPAIVQEISNGNEKGLQPWINLQGYLLGNPITTYRELNYQIPFAHGMGLISDELYEALQKNCKGEYQDIDSRNELCSRDVKYFNEDFPNFYCNNCKYKEHQCFACGKLGSSNVSSKAEVFPCVTANCGQYYHPECVARLLSPDTVTKYEETIKSIANGNAFVCPLHICVSCRQGENKNVHDLQFAMCRRCPKAFHRKCLPKEISFTDNYYEGIEQRAWDGLLDQRILMYCTDHEIVPELGTPARDHLIFPNVKIRFKIGRPILAAKKKVAISSMRSLEDLRPKKTLVPNPVIKERVSIKNDGSSKAMEKICPKKDIRLSTGSVMFDRDREYMKLKKMSLPNSSFPRPDRKFSVGKDNLSCSSRLQEARPQQQKFIGRSIEETSLEKPLGRKVQTSLYSSDADMESRMLSLRKDSNSAFNMEEFKKNHQIFDTSSSFTKTLIDKNLTEGKLEGSVKAVQTALQRLEEGCSIEDAKAICEPGIVHQLFVWQKRLKVYLAPFLHGMRYTSYGRHFTKIDKLKEVVDRLHCYVQNGDTVLDFCCGSNDFSCLMKSKLEETGKSCSFKNYDLFQAKNDFNFEKRDWMSVNAEELPNGSELIIGLNPPFGVRGSLANKFIGKALTFRPKLLILIVPKVTKRLDRKKGGYNLIWEDDELLSGKSFYLPGSVDTREKQLDDWNVKPPPLYLWSRPDWTARHREIAQRHGHIKENYNPQAKGKVIKNYLMEENHDCYQDYRGLHAPDDYLSIFDGVPDDTADNTLEEGATSKTTLGQLKESVISDCGREMDREDWLPTNDDSDMVTDMEISSQ